jgi:hypothetical protein
MALKLKPPAIIVHCAFFITSASVIFAELILLYYLCKQDIKRLNNNPQI